MDRNRQERNLTWDAMLFFAFYVVAPEYCGIEFSSKLPLLTVSRAILVLMGVLILARWRQDMFQLPLSIDRMHLLLTDERLLRYGLMAYFALLLLANAYFLPEIPTRALKQIATILMEQFGLVWVLSWMLDSRNKLEKGLKIFIYSAGIVAVLAAVSVVLEDNLFYRLKTVQREIPIASFYRLGVLRAEASFDHPVYYGAFCATIAPIAIYLIANSQSVVERWGLRICFAANIVALVLSNSRGSMLACGVLVLVVVALYVYRHQFKKLLIEQLPTIVIFVLLLSLVLVCLPSGAAFFAGVTTSIMDIFPSDAATLQVLEPLIPEDEDFYISEDGTVENKSFYGENPNGFESRWVQLSGIEWTLQHNAMFGFGPEAHLRGKISYQFDSDVWTETDTFDVAIVGIIGQYGILGLLGYIVLYGSLLITMAKNQYRKDPLMCYLLLSFGTYMLCQLTITHVERLEWMIIGCIFSLVNILRKEEKAKP